MEPKITKVTLDGRFGSSPSDRPTIRIVFDYAIPEDRRVRVGTAFEMADVRPWWFHSVSLRPWSQEGGYAEVLGCDREIPRDDDIHQIGFYTGQALIFAERIVRILDKIVDVEKLVDQRAGEMTIKVSTGVQAGYVSFVHATGSTRFPWKVDEPFELPPADEIQAAILEAEKKRLAEMAASRQEREGWDALHRKSAARTAVETRELNRKLEDLRAQVNAWKPEQDPRWVCDDCGKVVIEPHGTPAEKSQLYVTDCPGRGGHVWELKPEVT